jgi:hypothetical protein
MDKVCLLRPADNRSGPAGELAFAASLVMRSGEAMSGLPASVVLPWYTQFAGQDRRMAHSLV